MLKPRCPSAYPFQLCCWKQLGAVNQKSDLKDCKTIKNLAIQIPCANSYFCSVIFLEEFVLLMAVSRQWPKSMSGLINGNKLNSQQFLKAITDIFVSKTGSIFKCWHKLLLFLIIFYIIVNWIYIECLNNIINLERASKTGKLWWAFFTFYRPSS